MILYNPSCVEGGVWLLTEELVLWEVWEVSVGLLVVFESGVVSDEVKFSGDCVVAEGVGSIGVVSCVVAEELSLVLLSVGDVVSWVTVEFASGTWVVDSEVLLITVLFLAGHLGTSFGYIIMGFEKCGNGGLG